MSDTGCKYHPDPCNFDPLGCTYCARIEGYRAALEAVKGEIEAERLHRSSQGYRSPLVVDNILARIARLEKEHGG